MRFAAWWLPFVLMAGGNALLRAGISVLIRRISLEYLTAIRSLPYESALLRWWTVIPCGMAEGARYGLMLGLFITACSTVASRRAATAREVAVGCAGILAAAGLGGLLAGSAACGLGKLSWLTLPAQISGQIGRPYRALFCYGLETGTAVGGILASLAVGILIWRKRDRRPACLPKVRTMPAPLQAGPCQAVSHVRESVPGSEGPEGRRHS